MTTEQKKSVRLLVTEEGKRIQLAVDLLPEATIMWETASGPVATSVAEANEAAMSFAKRLEDAFRDLEPPLAPNGTRGIPGISAVADIAHYWCLEGTTVVMYAGRGPWFTYRQAFSATRVPKARAMSLLAEAIALLYGHCAGGEAKASSGRLPLPAGATFKPNEPTDFQVRVVVGGRNAAGLPRWRLRFSRKAPEITFIAQYPGRFKLSEWRKLAAGLLHEFCLFQGQETEDAEGRKPCDSDGDHNGTIYVESDNHKAKTVSFCVDAGFSVSLDVEVPFEAVAPQLVRALDYAEKAGLPFADE